MEQSLKDRIALVTGGSAGIGRAIARTLVDAGAKVVITGRNRAALESAATELGPGATAFTADMGDEGDVRRLAQHMQDAWGGVDLLIQNAGTYAAAPVETASLDDLDLQWHVNFRGPYLLTQLLLPALKQRRGQVVFINSSAGARPHANVSQYSATKAALKAFADALREEVNPDGVRVITIFPGRTATPLQERVLQHENRPYDPAKLLQAEDVAEVVLTSLKLPAPAEVTDLHVRPIRRL